MKYPKITALAPTGEDFKEEAVNEGVWLTEAHLASIETSVSNAELAATTAATALQEANAEKTAAQDALAIEKTAAADAATKAAEELAAANSLAATRQTEIEALQAENTRLSNSAAAAILNTSVDEDVPPVGGRKESAINSDSDPFNQFADSILGKPKQKTS